MSSHFEPNPAHLRKHNGPSPRLFGPTDPLLRWAKRLFWIGMTIGVTGAIVTFASAVTGTTLIDWIDSYREWAAKR